MHKELLELSKMQEISSIHFYGSYARAIVRGDMSLWDGKDIDTLIFTRGKKYETPHVVHEFIASLDPIYDTFTHNAEEMRGIITDVFNPTMSNHLASLCLPFYGEDLRSKFQRSRKIWEEARKKTGIETNFYFDASDKLRHLRVGYTNIIKNPESIDRKTLKKQNNRTLSLMRIALTMRGIDMGTNDESKNVVEEFFRTYKSINNQKPVAERLVREDFFSLIQKDVLESVRKWKGVGENVAYAVDRYLCGLIGI